MSEKVYITQPPSYLDTSYPNYVCKLNKTIYDLKQAQKSWYLRLGNFLILNEFQNSHSDSSLFVYNKDMILIWLIVYVDH